ncbi:MAG: cobalt ECF transporter T component CbiQ [Candidatus Odinarchaeota archaeon]
MLFSKLYEFVKDVFVLEESAQKNFFLQKLDPRVKLAATIIGVVCVILISNIIFYAFFIITGLILAAASRVNIKDFILRSLVFIVVFTLLISIPLLFITPGRVIASTSIFGLTLTVTVEGVCNSLTLVLRVWAALSLLNLLVMTTRFDQVTTALSTLKAPRLFLILFDLTLKYIFVIAYEALRINRAQQARQFHKPGLIERIKSVAPVTVNIFLRSHIRAGNVYNAMLARGFNGKYHTLNVLKLKRADIIYLVLSAGFFITLILIDRGIIFPNITLLLTI